MRIELVLALLIAALPALAQPPVDMRYEDKIRIKEAMGIAKKHGDKIWENFSAQPFVILLVTDSVEYLVNHGNPSKDFFLLHCDTILHSNVYYRKRVYSPKFLATFPAVNGVPTIVVGSPENTGKTSVEWIITLLHEHFHQYQMSNPLYFKAVNGLDLSGGDETGMWMLNYAFPYDSIPVADQFKKVTAALKTALTNKGSKSFKSALTKYVAERKKLKSLLEPADYRYLSLQVWQEGLARYTEFKFLELLAQEVPSPQVAALTDYVAYPELKKKFYQNEISNLTGLKLNEVHRVGFYSLGFTEGLLLDVINKKWRKQYLKKMFFIEHYAPQFN